MTNKAAVYYSNHRAGILSKSGNTFTFIYDADYMKNADAFPISISLPLQADPYEFASFPPFFDGLLPEGWLLDLTTSKYKIEKGDKFALLLAIGSNSMGAVHIEPLESNDA